MLREPLQINAGHPACPRAGHGCAGDELPMTVAAGWDLVQRDWGLRQREPGSPRALERAVARVVRLARAAAHIVRRRAPDL
jgi:hypothetical protein